MPIGGGGSGGGAAFNGGTITGALELVLAESTGDAVYIHDAGFGYEVQLKRDGSINLTTASGAAMAVGAAANLLNITDSSGGGRIKCTELGTVLIGSGDATDRLGFFGHSAAAQPQLASGTATPEQIALALEACGLCGGT